LLESRNDRRAYPAFRWVHGVVGRRTGALVVSAPAQCVLARLDRGLLAGRERRRDTGSAPPRSPDSRAAAHLLVRWCAGELTGRPPELFEVVQRCAECGSPDHGKPSVAGLPDLHISLAHRPGVVAAAAGWSPVGVDVEVPRAPGAAPVPVPELLSAGELAQIHAAADPATAFLRLWVRKECLVKLGVTTLDALAGIDLSVAADRPLAGGGTVARYGQVHLADWVDRSTGAIVAAAGREAPVRGWFPPG
jgi:4'-phosphopantetheinyl transferase